MMIFNRYKRFGFPWTGGWAEQPEYIVQLVETFDATIDAFERHKMKKRKK